MNTFPLSKYFYLVLMNSLKWFNIFYWNIIKIFIRFLLLITYNLYFIGTYNLYFENQTKVKDLRWIVTLWIYSLQSQSECNIQDGWTRSFYRIHEIWHPKKTFKIVIVKFRFWRWKLKSSSSINSIIIFQSIIINNNNQKNLLPLSLSDHYNHIEIWF